MDVTLPHQQQSILKQVLFFFAFEVPVNPETRVRMLPGQEDHRSSSSHHHSSQQGRTGEVETSVAGRSSRLLPPRQESSESYTSNQSSSLGSSSATTTSPPPPKPPRSSPATDEGHPTTGGDQQYGSRGGPQGRTQSVPSRPDPPVVARSSVPLYASGPSNVARNSVRNFQAPPPQLERSAYLDFSDSADSGHQASSNSSRAPPHRGGERGGPTSPQILLHPPTPIGRQGSLQRAQQDDKVRQRRPSPDEATPSNSRSMQSTESSRRTFSPVLSSRDYQQPISHVVMTQNPETSRGDPLVGNRHLSNNHDDDGDDPSSATRQPDGGYPRHLPQPPSSNARIPTPQLNPLNFRSPSTAALSSAKTLSNSSSSFRSHSDSRSRGGSGGVRSGTSSPNTWNRMGLRRRETLPNIVHYPPPPNTSSKPDKDGGGDPRRSSRETYIVENGVRRRLITDPSGWETPVTEREPSVLLQRFTLEPTAPTGLKKRGIEASLPDVYRVRETTTCIPREQVFAISQQRRDELRREREERERETVVIRLADIKVTYNILKVDVL